ncbi:hypothetical protein RJ639_040905 [Escallonia herrerae]|uniref:RING-type E3 ubiquitin transferase (cysteine targeting) n=1 Tax=Escallonia herrerae TaxID=1293975 RepID=A0AA89B5P0_9ASTE|nr:hypothetical protein RJ639_040905 [Escallonia herrerae]
MLFFYEFLQSDILIAISRVNQVDAARLDVEMSAMLKEQLVKVFSLMKPGLLFQHEPELDAFLEFLIWRFSIWVDKPTPGNALMNLRYRDERATETRGKESGEISTLCGGEMAVLVRSPANKVYAFGHPSVESILDRYAASRPPGQPDVHVNASMDEPGSTPIALPTANLGTIHHMLSAYASHPPVRTGLEGPGLTLAQKIWYCVATVGGQYIWARLQSFSAFRRWGDSEQRSVARRAWFLIQRAEGFYKAGSFINLLIFLYTGRYRNLIERALQARLVYGSPHMNRAVSFEYMNRQLVWNEFSEMLLLLLPLLNSSSIKSFLRPFSKDKSLTSAEDETLCPICQAYPTIPFVALPCQHRYCYYCLQTRCSAAPSFRCSRCSEPVIAMQRYSGSTNNVSQKQ